MKSKDISSNSTSTTSVPSSGSEVLGDGIQSRKSKASKAIPKKPSTTALARRLFASPEAKAKGIAWPRPRLARWVLARLRVDSGTWRFPISEKHMDSAEAPISLRKLPPGPPLEITETVSDKRRKIFRYVKGFVK